MSDLATFRRLLVPANAPKRGRVLHALARGRSLNRFEAFSLHDTALHSTISALRNKYGVRIEGKRETVRAYRGELCHVVRYWLDLEAHPDNGARVLRLLESWGYRDPLAGNS